MNVKMSSVFKKISQNLYIFSTLYEVTTHLLYQKVLIKLKEKRKSN